MKFDTRRWAGYFGMPTDSIYVPTYYQDGKVVEELGAFVNSDGYAVRDFNKDEYENRVYERIIFIWICILEQMEAFIITIIIARGIKTEILLSSV